MELFKLSFTHKQSHYSQLILERGFFAPLTPDHVISNMNLSHLDTDTLQSAKNLYRVFSNSLHPLDCILIFHVILSFILQDLEQLLNYIGAESLGPRHVLPNLKELMQIILSEEYINV